MTARAVTRAFDRLRLAGVVQVSLPAPRILRPVAAARRQMGVWPALCWAFGTECARLDLDEGAALVVGADSVVLVERIGMLGCRVDGGGRSHAHADADVIASYLAALPPGCGGAGMAVHIAGLARAGRMPDAMVGVRPRCVPVGWKRNQTGVWARTEIVDEVVTLHRGRRVRRVVECCPVTWHPTAGQIVSARRAWRDWRLALFDLSSRLRSCARLETIQITPDLPPAAPWDTGY